MSGQRTHWEVKDGIVSLFGVSATKDGQRIDFSDGTWLKTDRRLTDEIAAHLGRIAATVHGPAHHQLPPVTTIRMNHYQALRLLLEDVLTPEVLMGTAETATTIEVACFLGRRLHSLVIDGDATHMGIEYCDEGGRVIRVPPRR